MEKLNFFERFEETANFGCVLRQKSYFWLFQKKFKFFWRTHVIFLKQPKVANVLGNLTVSDALYSKIATSSHFRKIKGFFSKNPHFPKQLKLFDVFEKSDKSSCILQSCILQQTCHHQWFLKNSNFFQDDPFILEETQFFVRFEKSHYFVRIRHQIGYLQLVSENSSFFFKKTICFFWITQILNFLRNHTVSVAFHIRFDTISIFWKFQNFFGRPIFFCRKTNFW